MVNIIDTQITDAEYTEISHRKQWWEKLFQKHEEHNAIVEAWLLWNVISDLVVKIGCCEIQNCYDLSQG